MPRVVQLFLTRTSRQPMPCADVDGSLLDSLEPIRPSTQMAPAFAEAIKPESG